MTDPNKAAVTESNADFLAKLRSEMFIAHGATKDWISREEFDRLIALAEERVMIEEHRLSIHAPYSETTQGWLVVSTKVDKLEVEQPSFSTAIRSVVAKIGEGK